ncbi:thaumatin-like protein [Pluteus cervinus]|uniref:Thaumatin-like protein n=1 Tax=Pluteus cervinus TaxID=181527 RepID=A0ACD3BBN1_9AGAR|nr:thaumatin-like protein [Pluteus cervinus]
MKVIIPALALISGAAARTFTVYNACPFTIWPAMFTDLNVAPNVPSFQTGWEAPAWSKVSFTVPDNWKAGRIWGRRNCNFGSNPGPNSCLTGGCNGGLLCDSRTGTGVPPATVAEWTLQADGNRDFYDVSLVDGYNLPMRITNNVGCPTAECAVDLGPNCKHQSPLGAVVGSVDRTLYVCLLGPPPLKGPFDSTGFPVGCKSACFANLDGNQGNSGNCCSGSHNTPQTCPTSGVAYYSYFKNACPTSYAYAYDEGSGTALWTCDSARRADYTLTFCP